MAAGLLGVNWSGTAKVKRTHLCLEANYSGSHFSPHLLPSTIKRSAQRRGEARRRGGAGGKRTDELALARQHLTERNAAGHAVQHRYRNVSLDDGRHAGQRGTTQNDDVGACNLQLRRAGGDKGLDSHP